MIFTIKANIKELSDDIVSFQRQYNNLIRWAYNRLMEDKSKTELFDMVKTDKCQLNHVDMLDLTWRREAIKIANAIALSDKKEDKVSVFQSKANSRRREGKTTREEFLKEKEESLIAIKCEGSKADNNGNRKFKFDAESLSGSVKLDKRTVYFSCENIGYNRQRELIKYLELAKEGLVGITYSIKPKYFYINIDTDDIKQRTYEPIKGRTLALDMNPNYIGLSIVNEKDSIIKKVAFDLHEIDRKNRNKYKFELTQVALKIKSLCKAYRVSLVGFEELKMRSCDHNKGKKFNKLVNRDWRRNYFINSLKKHLDLINCKYKEIAPQYSSFIGCVCYQDDTDSIAASIELNRRLRLFNEIYNEKTKPKQSIVYPEVDSGTINHWKEEAGLSGDCKDWDSFYDICKKAGHSYRFLYKDWVNKKSVKELRLNGSIKSKVKFVDLNVNEKLLFS